MKENELLYSVSFFKVLVAWNSRLSVAGYVLGVLCGRWQAIIVTVCCSKKVGNFCFKNFEPITGTLLTFYIVIRNNIIIFSCDYAFYKF